jgi:hypothetical protein
MTPQDSPPGGFGVEPPYLVGMTTHEATEAASERGIKNVRVLESVNGMTITVVSMDWVSTRLSLTVEGGIVVSAELARSHDCPGTAGRRQFPTLAMRHNGDTQIRPRRLSTMTL